MPSRYHAMCCRAHGLRGISTAFDWPDNAFSSQCPSARLLPQPGYHTRYRATSWYLQVYWKTTPTNTCQRIPYHADDFHNPEFTTFGNIRQNLRERRAWFDVRMEPRWAWGWVIPHRETVQRDLHQGQWIWLAAWISPRDPGHTALLYQLSASSSLPAWSPAIPKWGHRTWDKNISVEVHCLCKGLITVFQSFGWGHAVQILWMVYSRSRKLLCWAVSIYPQQKSCSATGKWPIPRGQVYTETYVGNIFCILGPQHILYKRSVCYWKSMYVSVIQSYFSSMHI